VQRLIGYLFETEAWLSDRGLNRSARAVWQITRVVLRVWDGSRRRAP
jgi:hypothetical protein